MYFKQAGDIKGNWGPLTISSITTSFQLSRHLLGIQGNLHPKSVGNHIHLPKQPDSTMCCERLLISSLLNHTALSGHLGNVLACTCWPTRSNKMYWNQTPKIDGKQILPSFRKGDKSKQRRETQEWSTTRIVRKSALISGHFVHRFCCSFNCGF